MEDVHSGNDAYLKRLACQIFTQLPESQGDALRALRYARIIVENLHVEWKSCAGGGNVTQLAACRRGPEGLTAGAPEASLGSPDIASQGLRLS
jgi:hypothetical protein